MTDGLFAYYRLLPSLVPLAAAQFLPTYAALAYGRWLGRRGR
jgi:hypothetical protein